MADEKSWSFSMDTLTKVVTFASLLIATFAALKAFPVDAEIKRLQAETQRLDLALKQAEADLKAIESSRKLTFELYEQVKKVIEKKEKDQREEDALRVLVEELADDPFRWKLLRVIALGAQSSEVKQRAAATSKFYEEEAVVKNRLSAPQALKVQAPASTAAIGTMNVDFFFCESKRATSEPIARKALQLKSANDSGRWRVRALPESINQQPGYGIAISEIRYTPPDETAAAAALKNAFDKHGVEMRLNETSYPTPGYVSVFVCE